MQNQRLIGWKNIIQLGIYTLAMKGVHNMKIAVSSNGEDLNAPLDPRFGRCAYFLIIETEDMSFEAFNNESAVQGGGAGIQAAQFVASQGAEAVITGNCGPNAVQMLSAAGIELFGGQTGTVREVIERFKNGHLKPTSEATVDSHLGMNAQTGFGLGDGIGGGRGMGRGMGGGRSKGRNMARSESSPSRKMARGSQSNDQELKELKKQADILNKKMKEVISRINSLENQ
jgi:predicted Fe-Mo cluster-binding NifX family protein